MNIRGIANILHDQAQRRPDEEFLRFHHAGDADLTFSAAWLLACRWANLLGASSSPGRTVLIALPNSPDFVGAFFGCLLAGLVPAPCVPRRGRDSVEYARDLEQRRRVTDAAIVVSEDREIAPGGMVALTAADLPDRATAHVPEPNGHPGLRQFTSGTGGGLKAVELGQAALVYQAEAIGRALRADPARDTALSWLPWFHDMGLFGFLLAPTVTGVRTSILRTEDFARRPTLWMEAASRERVTITAGPPSAYVLAARLAARRQGDGLDLGALRVALVGAERITPAAIARIEDGLGPVGLRPGTMLCAYGMAEVGVAVTMSAPETPVRLAETGSCAPVGCGHPLPGTAVRVVAPDGSVLPDGQVGQIVLKSPSLLTRYLTGDGPCSPLDPEGWFATHDLGHVEDGVVFVHGRSDEMIVVAGENYPPEAFEDAVVECGLPIGEVVAVGRFDERQGTERVTVIVESRAASADGAAVAGAIRRALAARQLPFADVLMVGPRTIRRTANGKLRRSSCRALIADRPVYA